MAGLPVAPALFAARRDHERKAAPRTGSMWDTVTVRPDAYPEPVAQRAAGARGATPLARVCIHPGHLLRLHLLADREPLPGNRSPRSLQHPDSAIHARTAAASHPGRIDDPGAGC